MSKAIQVAFQGEQGAYSEQAIRAYFKSESIKTIPCVSFSDTLNCLANKKVTYAMLPIENSIAGSVVSAYDALLKHNLRVHQEVILKVEHCLMANENADIDDIERVRSHPQALAQCTNNLTRLDLSVLPFVDTAGAAKSIAENRLLTEAAIAGELAAQTYGLKILLRNFEDEPFNHTRFFLLGNITVAKAYQPDCYYKTSIVFATLDKPNALVEILSCLSDREINMTKIESRPSRLKAWDCIFFLDFEGHEAQEKIQQALLEILKKSSYLKCLGSYCSSFFKL